MAVWIILLILYSFAGRSLAGECCKAHYDLTLTRQDEKWCDNYCCGTSALGILDCCDNFLLQAPSDDRLGFCFDFFAQNVWAPILIGLGGLGVLLTCVACCYCCCKSSTSSAGRVVAPAQQPYHTNVMLLQPGAPQHPGYDPSAAVYHPVHPAPSVQTVPGNQQTDSKHPFGSQEV